MVVTKMVSAKPVGRKELGSVVEIDCDSMVRGQV